MLYKSGIVWGSNTVQFRFLFYHDLNEYIRRYKTELWFGTRILDLITATFIPYTKDNDRVSYYDKSFGALREALDIGNPYISTKQTNKPEVTDNDREKYLRAFGDKPFTSMGDIINAMDNINKKVEDNKK